MLLVLACMLAAVAAAPSFDQRQDGKLNAQADISNIVVIVGLPKKLPVSSLLAGLLMSSKSGDESNAQDRSDVHSLGAFVEPNTPYRVIIGAEGERIVEADGANAIVIPSRRRLEGEPHEEMKLIGATEQCGPERTRDPVTLVYFRSDFVRIGPKKYFILKGFLSGAANIYNLKLSSDDTLVVTYPRSGTTLTQELVWLLSNNLDYEKAESIKLNERFPCIEMSTLVDFEKLPLTANQREIMKETIIPVTLEDLEEMPSPRFIKSHLPLSLLPPTLLDKTKVVYVVREPRDVVYSFYKYHKFMKFISPEKQFKKFWEFFISNNILWSPYFEHILEAWVKRSHPNLLFLFYDDMIQDLPAAIRRVANFYNKTLTEEQVNRLAEHLDINNFKKNKSLNREDMKQHGILTNDGAFIRKGKSGGWRDHFDEEMTAQADEWIASHLRDTDFRFPNLHC